MSTPPGIYTNPTRTRIKFGAGAPTSLKVGEIVFNVDDQMIYLGLGDTLGATATSIEAVPAGGGGGGGVTLPIAQSDVSGLVAALAAKAPSTHNHDSSYAALGHNHDSAYAAIGHNHDSAYAAIGHNHDSAYAALSHTHVIGDVTGLQTALDAKAGLASPSFTGTVSVGQIQGSGGDMLRSDYGFKSINPTASTYEYQWLYNGSSSNFAGVRTALQCYNTVSHIRQYSANFFITALQNSMLFASSAGDIVFQPAASSFESTPNDADTRLRIGTSQVKVGTNLLVTGTVSASNLSGTNTGDQDLSGYATTASVSGKEPAITAGTTSQYWRGDKSWQTLDKAAVGLSNVTNVAQQPLDADLTAIAALAGTSGLLKKTAADTWTLDTSTYLTANQSITLSGDISGTGSTAITTTIGNNKVTRGMMAATTGAALLGASSAGNVTDLTGTQATALLNTFTTTAKGLVPAPATSTGLFLKDDGTWAAAGGGSGTVTSVSVTTANGVSGSVATATTTPAITLTLGAITPSSVAATGAITSSGTAGIGYATGAGGTVTQATSRTTGVTLNKLSGAITLFSKTTTAGLSETFTVTNSTVAATDTISLSVKSGSGPYFLTTGAVSAGSFTITVYTPAAVSPANAPVINFNVIKGVAA